MSIVNQEYLKDAKDTAELLEALDIIAKNSGPITQNQGYAIIRERTAIANRFLELHIKGYSESPCSDHISPQGNNE